VDQFYNMCWFFLGGGGETRSRLIILGGMAVPPNIMQLQDSVLGIGHF